MRVASLSFYETVLTLPLTHDLPVIVLPSSTFTFHCLLAHDAMSISRMCGLMDGMRGALSGAGVGVMLGRDEAGIDDTVEQLNSHLVHFINAL